MDMDLLRRVVNMLGYITPQETMVELVQEGLTPERAHIIICAAMVFMS